MPADVARARLLALHHHLCPAPASEMPPKAESKKQKAAADGDDDGKEVKKQKRAPPTPWTPDEEYALFDACMKLARSSCTTIAEHPGLSARNTSAVGVKLRQIAARYEKNHTGF